MQLNSIASAYSYKDAMAQHLNALLGRNVQKLREAHHRRFAYFGLSPLLLKGTYLEPHKHAERELFAFVDAKPVHAVAHSYMSPTDWCKYTGETLRKMRHEKGCGKIPKERPRRLQQHVQIMLPWNAQRRVITFDIRRGDDGKPFYGDVKILRKDSQRRDKRLERSLTDEQWLSLYNQLTRVLRPAPMPTYP
jgi:hypothetical protein